MGVGTTAGASDRVKVGLAVGTAVGTAVGVGVGSVIAAPPGWMDGTTRPCAGTGGSPVVFVAMARAPR